MTTLVGVLFGLAPGLHRAHATSPAMHDTGRGSVRGGMRARGALVVAEVALATVLLVCTGLLTRSAERIFSQPLGFEPSGVAVMKVYGTGLERGDLVTHRFFDEALEAVRGVPGVVSASMTSQLPLSGDGDVYGVVPDDPNVVEGTLGPAARYAVAPGYLATMGVPLLRGRWFDSTDGEGAPRVAMVSRSLARRLFPDGEALGRRVRAGAVELDPYTVVGVVEDVKHFSLAEASSEAVYIPNHQWHWADRVRWVVVRAEADATGLIPGIRRAIWSADPNQPITRAQSMETVVANSEARRRFVLMVLSCFAFSALAVCVVGLFGVLSGSVTERTREMGVRAALGASPERNVRMVVRQGLAMAGAGLVIGAVVAASLSGALSSMLFETTRLDPVTYLAVIALLGVGAGIASLMPALRAGRADPVDALRAQ